MVFNEISKFSDHSMIGLENICPMNLADRFLIGGFHYF